MVLGSATLFAQDLANGEHGSAEPRMAGVHWAKGEAPPNGQAGGSPNLINHGGPIMAGSAVVKAIFWGTSWSASDPKIAGISSFYSALSGSKYIGTNGEYSSSNGSVTNVITNLGYSIDNSKGPKNANITSPILAEVCKVITNPVTNGYYPVYVDTNRGHAGFCAWHSTGTCGGVQVQFAFFFNLDGDAGCDPGDTSGLHSQGLSALANVSGHEISEALTDPHLNAWYDSSGAENADKCAWTFGHPLLTLSDNSQWKIQGNWSNAAFNTNSGYTKGGCIDGN